MKHTTHTRSIQLQFLMPNIKFPIQLTSQTSQACIAVWSPILLHVLRNVFINCSPWISLVRPSTMRHRITFVNHALHILDRLHLLPLRIFSCLKNLFPDNYWLSFMWYVQADLSDCPFNGGLCAFFSSTPVALWFGEVLMPSCKGKFVHSRNHSSTKINR